MHLANGDIDVQRSVLPPGTAGVDETVARMQEMAKGEYGAKSAKIRALAINIINAAGIGDKDYYGMAKAIHNWVRDEIRYVKDPVGQETLSFPEETAFNSLAGDCDDKTILEIALLGSIGIRAYPVVIGVRPGHYSHVYCHVEIPQGGRPGRHAGETLPADPIMREWEFGREAPAEKIAQKKTYEDLAGLGDLPRRRRRGTMPARNTTMSLGSYVTGPSYLDQQNVSSVNPAMRATLVDTAGRGEILNAPKVNERNTDEVDRMFDAGAVSVFKNAPSWDMAAYGPVTGAEASGSIDPLKVRTYETAFGRKSFASNRRTKVVDAPTRMLPGLAPSGVMIDETSDDSVSGLGQIAEYINSIMGEGLSGKPERVVAAAYLAQRRAATRRAKIATRAGFLPGMGDEEADFLPGMGDVVQAKKAADNAIRLAGSVAPKRVARAAHAVARLDAAGVVGRIEAKPIPTAHKVKLLHRALYVPYPSPNKPFPGDSRPATSIQRALYTRLPAGGSVQAHPGALAEDIEGLGKNIFERVSDAVKRSDVFSASAMKNLVGSAKQFTKTPWKTLGKGGYRLLDTATVGTVSLASRLLAPIAPAAKLSRMSTGSPAGFAAPLGQVLSGPQYRPIPAAASPQPLPDTPVTPVTGQPVTPQTPYYPDQTIPNEQTQYQPSYYPQTAPGVNPNAYSAWGSAPPVDTFGPQDMGPAQFAESAGSDQVLTTEMVAQGDQAPAQWSGGGDAPADEDGGERPELFMDEGDDESEGSAPAPRRRVRRAARRAARRQPVEIDEADDAYLVEDEMDEGGRTDDTDVAGLGALNEKDIESRARAAYQAYDDKKTPYEDPVTRQYWRDAVVAWDQGPAATAAFDALQKARKARILKESVSKSDAAIRELEALVARDATPEIVPGGGSTAPAQGKKPNYTVPVIVGVLGLATVLFLANRK